MPHTPAPHEHLWLKSELGDRVDGVAYKKGQGCSHCANTGYQGRQAVYEFLDMNNALVEAVNRGDPNEFMQIGREQMGGNTLRRDAVRQRRHLHRRRQRLHVRVPDRLRRHELRERDDLGEHQPEHRQHRRAHLRGRR